MSATGQMAARLAALEQQVATLRSQAGGGEQLSPNYLTVNDQGQVGASFTGLVNALGLVIPAFTTGIGGAAGVNRVAWTRASDGAAHADLSAGTNPPATAQQSQLFLSAESPDIAGGPTSGVAAFANASGPGATRVDVFADSVSARLLARDGSSSFLQLLSTQNLKLDLGSGAQFTGGGTQFVFFTIPHGLGRAPQVAGGWIEAASGQGFITRDAGHDTAAVLGLCANAGTGNTWANGTHYAVTWIAVG